MGRLPGLAVMAICAVFAAVGCTARQAAAPAAAGASSASSAAVLSGAAVTGRPAAVPAPSARQRAEADAGAILASFRPPRGAQRLKGPPNADYGALGQPDTFYPGPDVADRASWWLAPGQPQTVLSWVRAHLPSRFMFTDAWTGGTSGVATSWGDDFWLPPVPAALDSRVLVVEVVHAGGGQTAIRVDGQVSWQPPRPAGKLVPPAARVVTVVAVPGSLPGPSPAPLTITNVTRARWMAALVDGLPFEGLPKSCPMHSLGTLRLTFRARSGGPALAVFTGEISGCYGLLSLGSKTLPVLDDGDEHVIAEMLAVAGLRWPGFGGSN